jgi:hypothetical protein
MLRPVQPRRIDLGTFESVEEMRHVADVVVTHAVFETIGRTLCCLDEDMLWLTHPVSDWTRMVSEVALMRFEEALDVVADDGIDVELLRERLSDSLSRNADSVLSMLLEYRRRRDGRALHAGWLEEYYAWAVPGDEPLQLDELGFCLKRSLEQVLRGLVEVIAACHELVAGSGHPAVKSYARVNVTWQASKRNGWES